MAVYTNVSDEDLAQYLTEYDLGKAIAFKGIAEGVENSNYFLETTSGRFILTLFEKRANPADLPYFIQLKQHLAANGYSCPLPVAAKDGKALRTLAGRPSVIITFLQGLSPRVPNAIQCRELGIGLAKLHQAAADFAMERENSLGPSSWPVLWDGREETAEALQPGLADKIINDLKHVAEAQSSLGAPSTPICFPTMRSFWAIGSRARSISTSPVRMRSLMISPFASMHGRSKVMVRSTIPKPPT